MVVIGAHTIACAGQGEVGCQIRPHSAAFVQRAEDRIASGRGSKRSYTQPSSADTTEMTAPPGTRKRPIATHRSQIEGSASWKGLRQGFTGARLPAFLLHNPCSDLGSGVEAQFGQQMLDMSLRCAR